MKNTGHEYESLVEEVFRQLDEQTTVATIEVTKNKILQGKTTSHEIDVYWEFQFRGIKYVTIFQAKDWKNKVPQGAMLQFQAILNDLPDQPRGIFVTRTGYQKGAIDVAKKNGIKIYELREPNDEDWKGKIKTIHLTINAFIPDNKIKIIHDDKWLNEQCEKLNIKNLNLEVYGDENKLYICNEDKSVWKSIYDLKREESVLLGKQEIHNVIKNISFEENKYLMTNDKRIPYLKISEIQVELNQSLITQELEIDGTEIVGFILKDLLEEKEFTFDKNVVLRP
ncbi:MAG: restriction endonuclease [Treponema sp.]|nr:restriction endonuclease [Treponema sp.]